MLNPAGLRVGTGRAAVSLALSCATLLGCDSGSDVPPLLQAVRIDDVAAAKHQLALGADPNTPLKDPPLAEAARLGDPKMIELLVAEGAKLDLRNFGRSPLQYAALNGKTAAVDKLIVLGADVCQLSEPSIGAGPEIARASAFAKFGKHEALAGHLRKLEAARCRAQG